MIQWPSISIIVPTYQREDVLCSTITDVLQQDYPDFEVLVVDQTRNHQSETLRYLEEVSQSGKIQWFQVDWASLPAARNYGVERSRGDIILFIDDDVELPAGYLKAHAQVLINKPDVGAVAGRVFDRMKLGDNPDLSIDYLPKEAMEPGIAWYYIDLVHTTQPQQVITARGCNMSFRRDLFEKHGLQFDERFRGNAVREESDFCLQLRKTGYMVWYAPEAHLIHLGEETGGCHDIGTRSLSYQITFYHNHFLMGLKNLNFGQAVRLYTRLFDCHVLGHPPCNKSGSPLKIVTRFGFYCLGFFDALKTLVRTGRQHRIHTRSSPNGQNSQNLHKGPSLLPKSGRC